MKIVALVARILLGLEFLVFGLNGFLHFLKMPPPPPGNLATFVGVLMGTQYMVPVYGIQVFSGALLLIGFFVPLALAVIAPVIVNILITHVLMAPNGIAPGAVAAVLWLILFIAYRKNFAGLFSPNAKAS